jgi:agmatinase
MTTSPIGPSDASISPRYAGIATFARLPRIEDVPRADIAVVGVPFDSGVSYRPGARFGPAHVREASRLLRPYNPVQDVEPFSTQQVVDAGDIAANPFNIDEAIAQIEEAATRLGADGTRLLTIGGDHTIALPLLRAVTKRTGPVAVLHFDAHLDTWDTYFGAPVTHGTPFRRASEEGLIDLEASIVLQILPAVQRATDTDVQARLGFAVIAAHEFETDGLARVIERMLVRLGDRPVYISVDIDVLDPSHAPGTGTPEAGGLTSRELLAIIRALSHLTIVGADVVEVAPAYDHAQLTAVAASHVAYEILSAMTPR